MDADAEEREIRKLCLYIDQIAGDIEVVEPIPLVPIPPYLDFFLDKLSAEWEMEKMAEEVNNLRAENKLLKDKIESQKDAVEFCSPLGPSIQDDMNRHMTKGFKKK